jgi:dienelactone hydrolase
MVGDHESTRVTFESGGLALAGYLYRPSGAEGTLPCVVMANGFTGTMDWVLAPYAARFAAAGFAALIFDYRYFGESEGRPRQLVSVRRQREDIRRAVAFARAREGIDPQRIALWGTSLGGGHVIAIAAEQAEQPAVAAVIAQVPGLDMVRKEARATLKVPASVVTLLAAAVRDAVQGVLGLPPYYAKVFGRPGETAVFSDPGLKPRFDALMATSPHWRNAFTPRFYLALPRFRPEAARGITVPLLVCVAEREVYGNPDFQAQVGRLAPRGEVLRYPAAHFDFYHGIFDRIVRDEIDFLRRHLAP